MNLPLIFSVSFALALVLSGLLIRLSYRRNILDYPKANAVHTRPVPMMGGLAIFASFLAVSAASGASRGLLPFFLGSLPIIASGIYDDMRGMKAPEKLLVQLVAGVIVISFGIVIDRIRIPFGPVMDTGGFAIPLTIIWLIFMTNLINVVDGLDGLAAGLSAIIFVTMLNFIGSAHTITQVVALLGAVSAFLLFNFHPAKMFLGNNGSTFLGFAIAYFSLITTQKSAVIPVLALPCYIAAVHVFDIAYAIARRSKNGVGIFVGDKRHIHHIMLDVVKSHRTTVLLFYLISAILAFLMLKAPI